MRRLFAPIVPLALVGLILPGCTKAGGSGSAVSPPEPRPAGAPWKIINFHEHVFKARHVENYLPAARQAGIVKTVLVPSPELTIYGKGSKSAGMEENFQTIMGLVSQYPNDFIPFTTLDPASPTKLEDLKRHHAQGAKGLKLYSGHSNFYEESDGLMPPGMDAVLQYLSDNSLPCLWHVRFGRFLEDFETNVLKKYPKLKLVIAHYGVAFWRPDGPVMKALPRLLDAYPNLNFDTSLGTRKILVDGMHMMAKHRDKFINLFRSYPDRFVMGTDMVITGNAEKTTSWMSKCIWAVRDQMEKDRFRFDLSAAWSKYFKAGRDPDGWIPGLGLPEPVLKAVYETTPHALLGLKP